MGADREAVGYAVLLPNGWRRIPLRSGTKAAIRSIVDDALARLARNVSRDKLTPYRIEFERRLTEMARKARGNGGVDLYLPVEYRNGTPVPASFIVSLGMIGVPAGEGMSGPSGFADTAGILSYLASEGDGASSVIVGGTPGTRREHVEAPVPGQEFQVRSRRVDYILPLPGQRDRWLIVAFSTPGDGDPDGDFAKLLVALFDAIISTFTWTSEADMDAPGTQVPDLRAGAEAPTRQGNGR
ncbi:MAG TPA: hypothetical protein VK817_15180 [Trebonia sp.]|nr:hypothetical protein [Trebonia sp.]